MKHKKKIEERKDKLNILNMLHPCKVVLHDIALNNELLSFYQQKSLINEEKLKQISSCSYTSNSFNNIGPNIKCGKKTVEDTKKKSVIINKRSSYKKRKKKYESECSEEIAEHDTHTHTISIDTNYIESQVSTIEEKHDNVIRSSEKRKNRVNSREKIVTECVHNVPIDIDTNEMVATSDEDDTIINTFEKEKDTTSIKERTVDNYTCNTPTNDTIYNNKNTLIVANKKHENISLYKEKSTLDKEDTDEYIHLSIDRSYDNATKKIMTDNEKDKIMTDNKKDNDTENDNISSSQKKRDTVNSSGTLGCHKISEMSDMNKKSVRSMSSNAKYLKKIPTSFECSNEVQVMCSIPIQKCDNLYLINVNSTDTKTLDEKTSYSAASAKNLHITSNIHINQKLSPVDIIKATTCVVKLQRIENDSYKKNVSANVINTDLGNSNSISRLATDIKTGVGTRLNDKYTYLIIDSAFKTSETKSKSNHIDEVVSKSPEIYTAYTKKQISLLAENNILSKQNMKTVRLKRKRHMIEDSYCEHDSIENFNYDNIKQTSHVNENAIEAENVTKEKEHPFSEKNKSYYISNMTKRALEINNNSNLRVENTANNNTSDLTDVGETHKVNPLISVNEERTIIQTGYKRCSSDNVKDSGSKRIKLNRHTPLDTDKNDLRKMLEEKRRLRQGQKLENTNSTTYKYNEKDISEQIRVNNTCNTISMNTSSINDKYNVTDTMNSLEVETNLSYVDNTSNTFGIVHESRDISDNTNTQEQYENSDVSEKTYNDHDKSDTNINNDNNDDNYDNNDDNYDNNDDNYDNNDNNYDNNDDNYDSDDDDCISLYANETFDESHEDLVVREEDHINKSVRHSKIDSIIREENNRNKSIHSNVYLMSDNSFDNYVKHNTREFNKEYENNIIDTTEALNRLNKTEETLNVQQQQTSCTNKVPLELLIMKVFKGYCFSVLRRNNCLKKRFSTCIFAHDMSRLITTITQKPVQTILDIIRHAIQPFPYFSEMFYSLYLPNLTVEQILTFFYMFYDGKNCSRTLSSECIKSIIVELSVRRKISLRVIVDCLVAYMPTKKLTELHTIIMVVTQLIKPNEYWDTLRTLYFALIPDKFVVHKILSNCTEHRHLHNVKDINKFLSTLDSVFISKLDGGILTKFRSLLIEQNGTNSSPTSCVAVSSQNFERNENNVGTIASPDCTVHTDISECDVLPCDAISTNNTDTIGIKKSEINNKDKSYVLKPIDEYYLPEPRSVFRYHEHCWKFYLDLDRLRMGLHQKDYNYVINILKFYVDERATDKIFFRACEILRNEVKKRSGNHDHVKNLLQHAVQRDVFGILGTLLFDLGLAVVASLIDEEAWGLAHRVIHSLNVYDFSYTATFYLLSAEIYLANKNPLEALNLLKTHNIICTSRSRWYIQSINDDEDIRNKLISILLDTLLCNEYLEHAFFLFRFLTIDQTSQYCPIDLSRYVDRLIILSLSTKDTVLIKEISTLTLKYTFALNATTCRALTSTVIHIDETLARKIYNYAKNIGVYSTLKLWPVTNVILSTDLTEEEIYVIVLQLLKDLLLDLGHAVEHVKVSDIRVFLILETKSFDEQYISSAKTQKYNDTIYSNAKCLIREVLKKRFNPPLFLQRIKDKRICRIQSKSLVNHLKELYCR